MKVRPKEGPSHLCSSPPPCGETHAAKRGVKPSVGRCNLPVRSMKRSLPRREQFPARMGGPTGSRAHQPTRSPRCAPRRAPPTPTADRPGGASLAPSPSRAAPRPVDGHRGVRPRVRVDADDDAHVILRSVFVEPRWALLISERRALAPLLSPTPVRSRRPFTRQKARRASRRQALREPADQGPQTLRKNRTPSRLNQAHTCAAGRPQVVVSENGVR